MSRLYDRIMAQRIQDSHVRELIETADEEPTVVVCDNVTKYLWEDNSQEYWEWSKDFPNIAPPFKWFFIETKAPKFINSDEFGITKWKSRPIAWGSFVLSWDLHREEFDYPHIDLKTIENARWVSMYSTILEIDRKNIVAAWQNIIFIKEDGVVYRHDFFPLNFIERMVEIGGDEVLAAAGKDSIMYLHSQLLAVSFMHCRNVAVRENIPPDKLSKKFRKKSGRGLSRFRTIEIMPMKRVLETEGRSGTVGLKQALSICRGHFKDFRDKGLFGRHKGVYWWGDHLRGSSKEGEVKKEYRVKPGGN